MSSSTVAYSDSPIPSDDMLLTSSPRLDASGEAPYDSGLDAEGEEVSGDDHWTLEEAQAAMAAMAVAEHGNGAPTSQYPVGPAVASHSKHKHIGNTKSCTNDIRFEEYERAVYGNKNYNNKKATSTSTVPKMSYGNSLPRKSRAKNNAVVKRKPPNAELTNVKQERHSSDDMQIDSTSGSKKYGLGGISIQGSVDSERTDPEPKRGQLDLQPFYLSMPRDRFIDGFMQIYLSSSGSEREHIRARLAECQEGLNVDAAPVTADRPTLPPVMGTRKGRSGVADLSAPAHPASRRQTRPANQMRQRNQRVSTQSLHSGKNVIDLTDLASDYEEFEQEGSFGNAPNFNTSSKSHAPAASNDRKTAQQYEPYGRGSSPYRQTARHLDCEWTSSEAHPYDNTYGPPITRYIINQFIQGSSQDGPQPSNNPLTSIRPPATDLQSHGPPSFLAAPTENHKRPHGPGWENGRSPIRRRVVSSPCYIDSSSPVPMPPSDRSSPPPIPPTKFPETNEDVVNAFIVPDPDGGPKGAWICVYNCPFTRNICNMSMSGSADKRNRYRHLATHVQREEDAVERGFLKAEDTLLLNRLKKQVVKCYLRGCNFRVEVWRTDKIRENHRQEAHPDVHEFLRKANQQSKEGKGKTGEDK